MAELKTKATNASVGKFIDSIADETQREDCRTLLAMMKQATRATPTMWGPSIVGFGSMRYAYESGRVLEWFRTGFSPRKQNLTLYIMSGWERHRKELARLGKHSTGKSCLYIKRLADVDVGVLRGLIADGLKATNALEKTMQQREKSSGAKKRTR